MTRATPGRRGVHLGLRGGAAGAMDRMITGGSALTQKAVPENFRPGTFLSSMGGERERERERGQCCRGQETDFGCTHPRAIVAFITARTKYADINKQAEGRRNALCRFDSPCGRVALARSIILDHDEIIRGRA